MTDGLACVTAFLGAPEVLCMYVCATTVPLVCLWETFRPKAAGVRPSRPSSDVWRWRGVLDAAQVVEPERGEGKGEGGGKPAPAPPKLKSVVISVMVRCDVK